MSSRSAIRRAVTVLLLGLAEGVHPCAAEEGPAGFNCVRDRSPLAVTVCSDRTAAAAERRTTVSYLAVYFGLSDQSRGSFHNDHIQWLKSVTTRCRPSPNLRQAGGDQPALSVECVRRLYTQRSDLYRKKLSGIALEESNLSPALLKKMQKRLVELKFLSGTADGIFGADTRAAIKSYQESTGHAQSNFLNAEERSMLLGPNAVPEQNASSTQTPTSAPEPSPEIASTPPATVQILQNTDDEPHEPNATGRA
jgi:Putative peptidoglycan binding domain